ncbi:hypothetical protein H4R33_006920 [Dimargaris cristalligena]|nr:hypothetical protein H4R33_006920 [Dimargaris cristalligena]
MSKSNSKSTKRSIVKKKQVSEAQVTKLRLIKAWVIENKPNIMCLRCNTKGHITDHGGNRFNCTSCNQRYKKVDLCAARNPELLQELEAKYPETGTTTKQPPPAQPAPVIALSTATSLGEASNIEVVSAGTISTDVITPATQSPEPPTMTTSITQGKRPHLASPVHASKRHCSTLSRPAIPNKATYAEVVRRLGLKGKDQQKCGLLALQRLYAKPKPPQFVYVRGISRMRIRELKDIFRSLGFYLPSVLNISFLGTETVEFLVAASYAVIFKGKIKDIELTLLPNFSTTGTMDPDASPAMRDRVQKAFIKRSLKIIAGTKNPLVAQTFRDILVEKKLYQFSAPPLLSAHSIPSASSSAQPPKSPVPPAQPFRFPPLALNQPHQDTGISLQCSIHTTIPCTCSLLSQLPNPPSVTVQEPQEAINITSSSTDSPCPSPQLPSSPNMCTSPHSDQLDLSEQPVSPLLHATPSVLGSNPNLHASPVVSVASSHHGPTPSPGLPTSDSDLLHLLVHPSSPGVPTPQSLLTQASTPPLPWIIETPSPILTRDYMSNPTNTSPSPNPMSPTQHPYLPQQTWNLWDKDQHYFLTLTSDDVERSHILLRNAATPDGPPVRTVSQMMADLDRREAEAEREYNRYLLSQYDAPHDLQ